MLNRQNDVNRVLVIGDLHEPFTLVEYLEFCISASEKYNTNKTIFIGDIVDNHFSSYHETDPDGMSAGGELSFAIRKLRAWREAFPRAKWILGNHDRLVSRKALTGGLSRQWLKPYNEVLEVPGWDMMEEYVLDDVQYLHGEGKSARNRATSDLMSTVQGHRHTEAYLQYYVGRNYKIFGMQVGCGIDKDSYNMAYAKNHPKPAIGCGVVLGGTPYLEMMEL